MYCSSGYNVLSIIKMLSQAVQASVEAQGSAASKERSFGFSVKDILDLPSTKLLNNNKSINFSPNLDSTTDSPVSSVSSVNVNVPPYHIPPPSSAAAASALYYSTGLCDNPYARWLNPHSDSVFAYSTTLRK